MNINTDGAIMEVCIALPNDMDTSTVEKAVTDSLNEYKAEPGNKAGNYRISLIKSFETYRYNAEDELELSFPIHRYIA